MINIAVDGPAGAGKSTVAKILAKKLGIVYLDTGAMYRAVAFKALRHHIDLSDVEAIQKMLKDIDIDIYYLGDEQRLLLDGDDITDLIRTPDISEGASKVAAIPAVRLKLVELQRFIAQKQDVVMDGRDIGTFVLPNADIKFYLTASLEERARRRQYELYQKGYNLSLEDIKRDIMDRDKNDASRSFAPLKKAEDAILIDTTNKTIDEVVEEMLDYIGQVSLA